MTVFDMNEVIREAVGFVSEDKKDETNEAKGGKGAKVKGQEAAPAELFVGLDSSAYKLVAQEILE